MKPFLPDLLVAPGLGRLFMILKLIQHPGLLILLQPGDKLLGSVALKIPDGIRQLVTGDHQVQMVVQDDISIDLQAFMLLAKFVGAHPCVRPHEGGHTGPPLRKSPRGWRELIISFAQSFFLYPLSPPAGERVRVRGDKKKKLFATAIYVKIGFPDEEGNPLDHRAGDEVGDAGLSDGIAGSHGSRGRKGGDKVAKQSFAGK
jgi:hypothetical protein